jgi:hypothetical protein
VILRDVKSYPTTHLTLSCCHSGRGGDIVEAANDAENTGGQRDVNGDLNAISCISRSEIRTERRDVYMHRTRTTLVPN